VFIVALAWIVYSTITVQGIPASELSTKGIVFYYLHHPIRFCDVIYATISNKPILISYWQTFVGILGWLDTPLGSDVYVAFAVLLCILAGVSFQRNTACLINWRKGLFIGVTIASGFLVFVVLLAGYTPHPAHVVACVVGRYFTTFFILLCYAIFDRRLSRIEFRLGLIIIFLMLCLSIAGMSSRLLTRYWLSSEVQIFQIRPNSPIDFDADAYYNLGVSYVKLGIYTQAISDFDRAIEINPEYADAYKGRGVAYGNLGNYTQAISDFDRAIEINPDYAMAYYDRGVVYEILGNNRQAISDFDRAIEINPEYAEAYNGRGLAYGKLGNNRQAISDFDRAIEINPDYAMAYHNRAVVYGILGNHMQEIEDLQKAARLGSKDAKK
jgi:Tfp pilus assembly protein PilF